MHLTKRRSAGQLPAAALPWTRASVWGAVIDTAAIIAAYRREMSPTETRGDSLTRWVAQLSVTLDSMASTVGQVRKMTKTSRAAALDHFFAKIEAEARVGRIATVDRVFDAVNAETDSLEFLIAVLTATLPWKNLLSSRPAFVDRVRVRLDNELGPERTKRILHSRA